MRSCIHQHRFQIFLLSFSSPRFHYRLVTYRRMKSDRTNEATARNASFPPRRRRSMRRLPLLLHAVCLAAAGRGARAHISEIISLLHSFDRRRSVLTHFTIRKRTLGTVVPALFRSFHSAFAVRRSSRFSRLSRSHRGRS